MSNEEDFKTRKTKVKYPVTYTGNLIILVLGLIIWLPLGLILLIKNGRFLKGDSIFLIAYRGNYVWLFFWSIVFFPIAILLFLIKGADWVEEIGNHPSNKIEKIKSTFKT